MKLRKNLKVKSSLNEKGYLFLQVMTILSTPILGCFLMNIGFNDIAMPWAFGDLLSHYQYQDAIWKTNDISSPHYGYPDGQDLRVWPFLDYFQSLLVGTFALCFPIFAAVNLTIISSFLFSALVLNSFGKAIGLRKFSIFLLTFAGVTLPWWPGRVQHFDYLFILVVLLPTINYLKITRNRRVTPIIFITALITGLCGPYLVAFSLIAGFIALLSGVILKKNKELFMLLTFILCVVPVFSYFASYTYFISGVDVTYPGLNRNIIEAIHLSGYALLPFLPLATTSAPILGRILNRAQLQDSPTEATWSSNYGSLLLLSCGILIFSVILLLPRVWLRFSQTPEKLKQTLWILSLQLGLMYLLFLRGGFGLLVSGILPELRAWNRITPLIQILVLALTLLLIQILWNKRNQKKLLYLFMILIVFQIDSVKQANLIQPRKTEKIVMQNFIKEFSQRIPKDCAVLQLPRVPYPLNGDTINMEDYDHFLVSILDRSHLYTYGSARMNMTSKSLEIDNSNFSEFCGIYFDSYAYSDKTQEEFLTIEFGKPIESTDKRFKFFVNQKHELSALDKGARL